MSWIKDQTQRHVPLNTMMIMANAKSVFVMVKKEAESDYAVEFTASLGSGKGFKDSSSLRNVNEW